MTALVVLGGLVVAVPLAAATTLVVGLRRRDPRVVGAVTRYQRSRVNPRQLETAGTAGARMSVVRHRGRRSGREYETPVGIRDTDAGLLVLLPYGSRADWVRNVRAAAAATVLHDGNTLEVDHPEVLALAEAAPLLTPWDRAVARLFGIREVLRLHPAPGPVSAGRREPEGFRREA